MAGRLDGKVAFITGAASGLGLAIARTFVAEGARVAMADIDEERGRREADGLGQLFVVHDVREEWQWQKHLAFAAGQLGKLDILVNNAGVVTYNPIEKATIEEWRFTMAVNGEGVFLGCKHAIPLLREAGGGSIVNMSSVAGIIGDPTLPVYCASKGAVTMLTKSVALYCARKRYEIRCNSIHPVFTQTPMLDGMLERARNPEKKRQAFVEAIPMGRVGQPQDIASAALFLASDESRFITGAEFVVDGGLTAG
jgi:NAD(P)-dependent dehydrogenase (short-subunit alcohol dehydrogenase family)